LQPLGPQVGIGIAATRAFPVPLQPLGPQVGIGIAATAFPVPLQPLGPQVGIGIAATAFPVPLQPLGPQVGIGIAAVKAFPVPLQPLGPQVGIGIAEITACWLLSVAWDVARAAEAPMAQIPRTRALTASFMTVVLLNQSCTAFDSVVVETPGYSEDYIW
jgi:hypothetical protein